MNASIRFVKGCCLFRNDLSEENMLMLGEAITSDFLARFGSR